MSAGRVDIAIHRGFRKPCLLSDPGHADPPVPGYQQEKMHDFIEGGGGQGTSPPDFKQTQEPDRSGKRTYHQNPPHAREMRTGTVETMTAHSRPFKTEDVIRDDFDGV